jgi:hypothetical protein
MNPTAAFRFSAAVGIALAPVMGGVLSAVAGKAQLSEIIALFQGASTLDRAKVIEITDAAWQYVVLPDRSLAKNPMAIEAWFGEHPADMWPVAVLAVWKLVEDFFPQGMTTAGAPPASSVPPA